MPALHAPEANHLLAALSDLDRARILPRLQLVPMPLGKVLYESGDVLRHVYLPIDCIVSLLSVMEDGASAEISVVGSDGIVGIALFMGGETTPSRAIVQSAGHAYRLIGQRLKDEFHSSSEMQHLLLRYTQALITQMAQTAVCNRHHSVDQQLCRWLLLALDRLSDNKCWVCAARASRKPQGNCRSVGQSSTAARISRYWTGQSSKRCVANATQWSNGSPIGCCRNRGTPHWGTLKSDD